MGDSIISRISALNAPGGEAVGAGAGAGAAGGFPRTMCTAESGSTPQMESRSSSFRIRPLKTILSSAGSGFGSGSFPLMTPFRERTVVPSCGRGQRGSRG
jgi:hypothetical protein